jgi:hypothetical protein
MQSMRLDRIALLALLTAVTGAGPWNNVGPQGGTPGAWLFDPADSNTIYAPTAVGVFKSTDGGLTFANAGLSGWVVGRLVMDRQNPPNLYALSSGHPNEDSSTTKIFKSSDGAATWTDTGAGLPADCCVVFASDTQGTLYAGVSNPGSGMFKSTDGGTTWTIGAGLPFSSLFIALVIDPQNRNILYAASAGVLAGKPVVTVYKSTDGAATWTASATGLQTANADFPRALAIDPTNPNTLYLTETLSGVHKSTNGGSNWVAANAGLPTTQEFVSPVAVDPANPNTLYVATRVNIYRSSNGGLTWSATGTDIGPGGSGWIVADPHRSGVAYAQTGKGIVRSMDGAATFEPYSQAVRALSVSALAIDPTNSGYMFAGSGGQVYKTSDAAATWLSAGGSFGDLVTAIAVDPQTTTTLYAGTGGPDCGDPGPPGIFKSVDGGWSWTNVQQRSGCVFSLALDPQNSATVYAGNNNLGVSKTTDGGVNWSAANVGLPTGRFGSIVTAIATDPQNPGAVYAASGSSLFKSSDGAVSWTDTGLASTVIALAVDPQNTAAVYAATANGLFKTADGGSTWRQLSTEVCNALVVDPRNTAAIYAGTDDGVLQSTDGGVTWQALAGSPQLVRVLMLDPRDSAMIYAGGPGGLFATTFVPDIP